MNKNVYTGRITHELQLKTAKNGNHFVAFSIAVKRNYKDKENKYPVDYPKFVIWGKGAELLYKYCHKGSRLGIEAQFRNNNYLNSDNKKIYDYFFLCQNIEFLDNKQNNVGESIEKVEPVMIQGDEEDYDGLDDEIQF